MGKPYLKNINTVSLKFIEDDRNHKDVIQVSRDQMGLSKEDLLGHGFAGKDSVHIILTNEDDYNMTAEYH